MTEPFQLARLPVATWLAIAILGCGSPAPQIGNFKRSPDPEPPRANAQAAAAEPLTQPASTQKISSETETGSPPRSPGGAAIVAPALPKTTSITVEPVDIAWSPDKKLEQTIARLQKISQALREHAVKAGRFPPAPGQQHSWRVLLLPYLGHAEQFARFNLQEPWDSPANVAAAKDTPPVYQSPWRSDNLTCFLAPLGPNTVLASQVGVDAARLNDKWGVVIELLMVDDEFAVAWSKPTDFVIASDGRSSGILGRDRGGFLAALADSQVRWVPVNIAPASLAALVTIGGDEYASPAVLTQSASDALPNFIGAVLSAALSKTDAASRQGSEVAANSEPARPSTPDVLLSPHKPEDQRAVLPDEEAVERARSLLARVFQTEIEKARKGDNPKFKHELAETLLKNELKAAGEPAEHFVLLHTARDYAAEAGDFKLAQQAASKLIERYRVDNFDLRRRTVLEANKSLLPHFEQQSDELRKECEQVLKLALQEDQFAAAKELLKVLVATSRRRSPDQKSDQTALRQQMQWLQALDKQIDEMEKVYQDVLPALKTLEETPADPAANSKLGAYLCLVKLRWLEGARHLAMGSNLRLKVLATEDMAPPVGPIGMADLANEYWALSDLESGLFKRGLRLRAVYWYRQALPELSASLTKVQAERRGLEAEAAYGELLVREAVALMDTSGDVRTSPVSE